MTERGFTLLESIVSTTIFVLLLMGFSGSLDGTNRFMKQQAQRERVSAGILSNMDRLADRMRLAETDDGLVIEKTENGTRVSFSRIEEVTSAGEIVLSKAKSIFWRLEAGETADGLDNDHDNRIDEGEIVWQDSDGTETVIATGIDREGFLVEETLHGGLKITIGVRAPGSRAGEGYLRSLDRTVPLR